LSGKATRSAYESALRSVRYLNTSIIPTALSKVITFSVDDGEAWSKVASRTVVIGAKNIAPTLTGADTAALKYTLKSPPLPVCPGIQAGDADNKHLQKAEVIFVQGLIVDEDILSVTPPQSMTAKYDAKTGVMVITGQDLVSAYTTVLQGVTYSNTKGAAASRSVKKVTFAVWDGIDWSAVATRDIGVDGVISSVETLSGEIPKDFGMQQNFPNPFNPSTTIHFGLPVESNVSLTVYDTRGRAIETLAQKLIPAGSYRIKWKASNLPSGVYYCRMVAVAAAANQTFVETKKLLLVK
jgi:hypothetical protein